MVYCFCSQCFCSQFCFCSVIASPWLKFGDISSNVNFLLNKKKSKSDCLVEDIEASSQKTSATKKLWFTRWNQGRIALIGIQLILIFARWHDMLCSSCLFGKRSVVDWNNTPVETGPIPKSEVKTAWLQPKVGFSPLSYRQQPDSDRWRIDLVTQKLCGYLVFSSAM